VISLEIIDSIPLDNTIGLKVFVVFVVCIHIKSYYSDLLIEQISEKSSVSVNYFITVRHDIHNRFHTSYNFPYWINILYKIESLLKL